VGKKIKAKQSSPGMNTLLFGVVLITIYFKQNSADPFNTPKLLLTLILCGFIIGPLAYSYYKVKIEKKSLEFKGFLLSIFFILSLTYALINTDVLIRGFIGETQRRNGYLHYLSMVVIFLYLARSISFEFVEKTIKICIWLNLILGSYGLVQITGNDFVDWTNPYNSMISTMGNPNFASSMLAFLMSVSLISVFTLKFSVLYKFIAFLGSTISIVAIVKSDSRQGLIVIAVIISLFISLSIVARNKKYRLLIATMNFSLFISGALGMLQIGPLQGLLYKESISVRGYYWRAGIEMFRDNILTGVGLDSYLNYFYRYREPGYPAKYGFEISSSNAHNTLIQMFATGGIFVGVTYCLILAYVLYCGIKLIKLVDKQNKGLSILLLTGWIGLQSQSVISIDFIGLSIWSWVFAGMIVGLSNAVNLQSKSVSTDVTTEKSETPRIRNVSTNFVFPRIISGIFLVPIIVIAVLINRVEEQTFNSPVLGSSKDKSLLIANSEKINDNFLADPYYKFKVALNLIDAGYFDQGVNIVKSLSKDDPNQVDYLKLLERVAIARNDISWAVDLRESISKIDPWNAQNYFELALLYKSLGNTEEVQKIKTIILDINTSTAISNQAKLELR